MATTTYYAWNNFTINGKKDKVKVGDKVTASDLGVSDDEFEAYVENGAVRTIQYPDMGNFPGSPVELSKAQLEAASRGGYFDTQYGRVSAAEEPETDPETGKALKNTK